MSATKTYRGFGTFQDSMTVDLHKEDKENKSSLGFLRGIAIELFSRLWTSHLLRKTQYLVKSEKLEHTIRQLRSVGISEYGLRKSEPKLLSEVLNDGEDIRAAISGRNTDNQSVFIVATSDRLIYINHIPLFTIVDEISYGVVDGVTWSIVGNWYANVTVHTTDTNFRLRFVNPRAADLLARFLDERCMNEKS